MLTTAITAAIVGTLAIFGVQPSAWLIGVIWVVVKVLIVLGIGGLVAKLWRLKATAVDG